LNSTANRSVSSTARYLFFPACHAAGDEPFDEVPALYAASPENVREKGSDACAPLRRAYYTAVRQLARHPRMVEPVMQFFGEAVYMHRSRSTARWLSDRDVAMDQDYGT